MKAKSVLATYVSVAFLTACGGGSSGSGSTPTSTSTTVSNPPANQTVGTVSGNLGNTPQAVIDQCMSDADKEMLSRVNTARSQARNCGSDNYPAVAVLSWHCGIESVAFNHSRDMGDNNFFSHTGSDGLSAGDRLTNAGYDWSAWGENIAGGRQSIEAVVSGWLNSPGHCANIMNAAYEEFGAALYTAPGSDYLDYWTQVFARPWN